MPWYNIDHVIPLTREQCNKLAQRITDLHAQTFTTPKFFVNVRYRDASDDWAYIAGKQRDTNQVKVCVRLGNHTKEVFDNLALKIVEAWNAIVNAGEQPKDQSRQLRTVCVVAEIVAAVEANFVLPEAGNEVLWAQEMMPEFEKRARTDSDIRDMVSEVKSRREFGIQG